MSDYHDLYRLDAKPVGIGGRGDVFRAEHRHTGAVVALKRRNDAITAAGDRMRREIQVQSVIQHLNVMPVLDFDRDAYQWFTMPLAETTLDGLALPLSTDVLATALRDGALGLKAAHASGHVHRDIEPSNVLRLNDAHGSRWVVADWGLVRRPQGLTTAEHTQVGAFLGTEGFAPPEAYSDAHAAGFAWDSYSLGRLAAWATTGTWPMPLNDLVAPEPWRRFVRLLTDNDPSKRPQEMERVLELLSYVTTELPAIPGISDATLAAAKRGDAQATVAVLRAAQDYEHDDAFFIDDVAQLSGPGLDLFVQQDPVAARTLLDLMDTHLQDINWGRRDFNYYNVPLHWMQRVAQAAADAGTLDLLEDACAVLFRHEPRWDRWDQAGKSRDWISSLHGPAAKCVAQVLREHPEAAKYYGALKHAVDPAIRAVLLTASSKSDDG